MTQSNNLPIKEEENEYIDSSNAISYKAESFEQENDLSFPKAQYISQDKLDKFLLDTVTESSMSPDIVNIGKDDELNNFSSQSSISKSRKSLKFAGRRSSTSVFNSNKFSVAVMIDNEKKDK